jgi:hypothetical protein
MLLALLLPGRVVARDRGFLTRVRHWRLRDFWRRDSRHGLWECRKWRSGCQRSVGNRREREKEGTAAGYAALSQGVPPAWSVQWEQATADSALRGRSPSLLADSTSKRRCSLLRLRATVIESAHSVRSDPDTSE